MSVGLFVSGMPAAPPCGPPHRARLRARSGGTSSRHDRDNEANPILCEPDWSEGAKGGTVVGAGRSGVRFPGLTSS